MTEQTEDFPRQIGRFKIRREIGRGTMGVVYEAEDTVLGRTVALKTIRSAFALSGEEREAFERRFLAEARIAAALSHPGIVVVHDVGRDLDTGVLYMALEYLVGSTLAEKAAGPPMEWREVLRTVGRVARALHYAHSQGVIHRDIKPANIMMLQSGEPKIMDFGVARVEAGQMTSPGELFGTPLYMAPEQALGQSVDSRTDLFALGTVAYTLLTARPPFDASTVPGILARVAYRAPPPPSGITPGIPKEIDYVVARAMAKLPGDRYSNGQALAEDIEDILEGRLPRHRAGWVWPKQADRTIVAKSGLGLTHEAELELLAEDLRAPEPAPRTKGRFGRRLLLLAAFSGAAAAYFLVNPRDWALWREVFQTALSEPRSIETASPSPLPASPRAVASPASLIGPSPSPQAEAEMPPAAEPPSPGQEPEPSPSMNAVTSPSPPEAHVTSEEHVKPPKAEVAGPKPAHPIPSPAQTAMGLLMVDFEHHLPGGVLELFVDDKPMLKEKLDSHTTRKILFFEVHKGNVQEVLKLPPGRHDVRVRVHWEDNVRSAETWGIFRPGATRHLEVKVSRLHGDVSLNWK